jgi:uncharacterized protein (TIGR02145 family)
MKNLVSVLIVFTVLASSVYAQDTIQVKAGWNIIGSVKAGAVPDVLGTLPDSIIISAFFGFTPDSGYRSTDTLGKGVGYWVKVKTDGAIVFDTTPAIDSCKSKAFIYQGKFYHTVKIGDQCWMAENLDVGTMVTGVTEQTDNDTTEKYCYNNDPLNCALYGGLYQWNEAMQYVTTEGAQGICPAGWHVPTWPEFETLALAVADEQNALKAVGQGTGGGAGTNSSGFSALLAGGRNPSGSFSGPGDFTRFWSSSVLGGRLGWARLTLDSYGGNILSFPNTSSTVEGYSVRCLAD